MSVHDTSNRPPEHSGNPLILSCPPLSGSGRPRDAVAYQVQVDLDGGRRATIDTRVATRLLVVHLALAELGGKLDLGAGAAGEMPAVLGREVASRHKRGEPRDGQRRRQRRGRFGHKHGEAGHGGDCFDWHFVMYYVDTRVSRVTKLELSFSVPQKICKKWPSGSLAAPFNLMVFCN